MPPLPEPCPLDLDDRAIRLAAAIQDLGDLVETLSQAARGPLPWQRQLLAELDGLSGLVQILRMSVVLERSGAEIREAAQALLLHTRQAAGAVAGSRADLTTRTALQLALQLALTIHTGLAASGGRAGPP